MTTKRRRGDRGMAPATIAALALVDAGTMNPHAASRVAGISYVTMWRALKRRKESTAGRVETTDLERGELEIKCTSANSPETIGEEGEK